MTCQDYTQLASTTFSLLAQTTSTASRWQQQVHKVLGANEHLAAGFLLTCYDRDTHEHTVMFQGLRCEARRCGVVKMASCLLDQ